MSLELGHFISLLKKKGDYSRDSGHELEVHEQGDIPRWDENASGHEGAIRV